MCLCVYVCVCLCMLRKRIDIEAWHDGKDLQSMQIYRLRLKPISILKFVTEWKTGAIV